jgi:uncharacterized membrane protein
VLLRRLSKLGVLCVFLAAVSAVRAQAPAAPPQFSVQPLSPLYSGDPVVKLINDRGSAAGTVLTHGPVRDRGDAFLQPPGGTRQILGQVPGGIATQPLDLNENDWIAGFAETESLQMRPVVWNARDGLIDLGVLPGGNHGVANAINNRNQVVGWIDSSAGRQAFVWEAGTGLRALPKPAGTGTATASGINDLGELPGGVEESAAFAINERNHVAGSSQIASGYEAVFWSQETGMIGLGLFRGRPDPRASTSTTMTGSSGPTPRKAPRRSPRRSCGRRNSGCTTSMTC